MLASPFGPPDTRRGAAATIDLQSGTGARCGDVAPRLPVLSIASLSGVPSHRTCGRSATPVPRLARVCPPGTRACAPLQRQGRRGRLKQVRSGVGASSAIGSGRHAWATLDRRTGSSWRWSVGWSRPGMTRDRPSNRRRLAPHSPLSGGCPDQCLPPHGAAGPYEHPAGAGARSAALPA